MLFFFVGLSVGVNFCLILYSMYFKRQQDLFIYNLNLLYIKMQNLINSGYLVEGDTEEMTEQ